MDDNVWIARATAGFAAIVGLAVAVGWLAGLPYLPQPLASCRPMHFNSAVITLLLALGLLALSAGRARLAAVCAACGGAIAGLTILEWLSGLDLRIDQLVVRDLIRFEDGTPPGRPSAPFLGSVLLAATSLFLIARQRAGRASVVAALACGTSGVLLLLTHLALAANPVDDTRHFVSPQAAACLCALSYGLLAAGEAARYGRRGPTVQAFPAAAAIFGILLSCVLWTQLRHKEQRELFASLRREEQIV
ncbi:MAG: hypothetical protein HY303_01400, partial [Candidatus Wallbacteria bacterium]|nr:hypothetical protein [Candidatus Wallbacteria bacterium]